MKRPQINVVKYGYFCLLLRLLLYSLNKPHKQGMRSGGATFELRMKLAANHIRVVA